jgi:hypothetical protein
MAIGGSVLPPTLVTRWFQRHRGLAIGIVHLPIVITIMPLAASLVISRFGVTALFFALAVFAAVTLIPGSLALIEYPPGHDPRQYANETAAQRSARGATGGETIFTVPQLLQNPRFWLLALAVGAVTRVRSRSPRTFRRWVSPGATPRHPPRRWLRSCRWWAWPARSYSVRC